MTPETIWGIVGLVLVIVSWLLLVGILLAMSRTSRSEEEPSLTEQIVVNDEYSKQYEKDVSYL